MAAMIQIKITGKGPQGIGRRLLGAVGRKAIYAAAAYWWTNYLPIHFTKRAFGRYPEYKPRNKDYSRAKVHRPPGKNGQDIEAIGEAKPLVWSGESRRLATGDKRIETKVHNYNAFDAFVKLGHARRINMVKGGPAELRAVTQEENLQLERIFQAEYEKELNRLGRTAGFSTTITG